MTITLRQESQDGATTKGSALSFAELDNNFIHFMTNGITVVGDDSTGKEITLGNSIKFAGGNNITVTVDQDSAAQGATVVNIAATGTGISNVVEDTTPQLGGSLDVNSQSIVSTANGNIVLAPNGTGKVKVDDANTALDYANYGVPSVLVEDTTSGAQFGIQHYLTGTAVSGTGDNVQYVGINFDDSGTYTSPSAGGDINLLMGYDFTNEVHTMNPTGGEFKLLPVTYYVDGTGTWPAGNDYAPTNITIGHDANDTAHSAVLKLETPLSKYQEKVTTLTDDSTADIHINCRTGTVSTFSLNDNKTFVFTNLDAGRSHTLIITNQGSYTATLQGSDSSAIKFPGGAPTITTGAGAIDVITVFYDGTNYLGNIAQDFQ